jgi:YesN/AraC family two-component response regulator
MRASTGRVELDAKNKQFLERLTGLAREGRRPLTEFLKLSGQAGEDDLRTMRSFLFELYCQIYDIDPRTAEGSSVRFKFFQELSKGESIEEITNLFIGNLYLTEYKLKARVPEPAGDLKPRGLAERARAVIDQAYSKRISLNSIANDLSVSKEHLSRVFKKKFGVTVTEYIHQVRIENARRLMSAGDYSLKQVCYETGYQSYNDFYRNFRKVTGVSPKCFVEPGSEIPELEPAAETVTEVVD